jgi:hypothetical protein
MTNPRESHTQTPALELWVTFTCGHHVMLDSNSQHELRYRPQELGSKGNIDTNPECRECQERETEECKIQILRETLIDCDLKTALEDSYYPDEQRDSLQVKSLFLAIIVLRLSGKPGLRIDEFLDRWAAIFVRSLSPDDQDEFLVVLKRGDVTQNADGEVNAGLEKGLATHNYFDVANRVSNFGMRLMAEEISSLALLKQLPFNIPAA